MEISGHCAALSQEDAGGDFQEGPGLRVLESIWEWGGRATVPGAPEQLVLVTSMCTPEPGRACQAFAEVLSFTCSYLPGPNVALKTPAQSPQCKSSNSPCGDGAQLAPAPPPPLPPQGHEDLLLGSAVPRC